MKIDLYRLAIHKYKLKIYLDRLAYKRTPAGFAKLQTVCKTGN